MYPSERAVLLVVVLILLALLLALLRSFTVLLIVTALRPIRLRAILILLGRLRAASSTLLARLRVRWRDVPAQRGPQRVVKIVVREE